MKAVSATSSLAVKYREGCCFVLNEDAGWMRIERSASIRQIRVIRVAPESEEAARGT